MADASPWILNGTEQNFESDVIGRSQEMLVVVDFWAEWCQPCRLLAPILEKFAREGNGQFLLVKVNVDEQQGLAGAFGVQSIPHVAALRNGQIADQFTGVLPEEQIRQWLDQFQPSPLELLLKEAQQLEKSDATSAEAKYREALELEPKNDRIKIALAKLLLAQHRDADSRAILTELEARGFLEPEAESIKAELELRTAAAEGGDVGECRKALATDPANPALQIKLADALAVAHQYAESLELLLQVVQMHPGAPREQARVTMVNVFQLLGPEADLARTFRRKLATALY
jgi:putative thioredoxin